jgi:hypothetical protein
MPFHVLFALVILLSVGIETSQAVYAKDTGFFCSCVFCALIL